MFENKASAESSMQPNQCAVVCIACHYIYCIILCIVSHSYLKSVYGKVGRHNHQVFKSGQG